MFFLSCRLLVYVLKWLRKERCNFHRCTTLTKYFSGELAESFSVLVRVLHSGQFKCVSPGDFKRTVGKFKSQFSGYDQQDSQELLAFLMDGLQEDLNKVRLVLDRYNNKL